MMVDHLWVVKNMIARIMNMGMIIVAIIGSRIFASWGLRAYYWKQWEISE